jgi:hypothetical protein
LSRPECPGHDAGRDAADDALKLFDLPPELKLGRLAGVHLTEAVKPHDVKPWGRLATFGLGLVALLGGQIAAIIGLAWWLGVGLGQMPDFGGDGVAVALIIFISTPIQSVLLVTFAQRLSISD